jgi:hypothetical protein
MRNDPEAKLAAARGEKWYRIAVPCKRGHMALRSVANGGCQECMYANRRSHPEYDRKADAKRAGPERRAQKATSERNRRQRPDVKAGRRAERMKRIADQKQRTPVWSDINTIKLMYEACADVERITGILHCVDHYYPLNGETVSGLHVSMNLQVITKEANLLKSNRMPAE